MAAEYGTAEYWKEQYDNEHKRKLALVKDSHELMKSLAHEAMGAPINPALHTVLGEGHPMKAELDDRNYAQLRRSVRHGQVKLHIDLRIDSNEWEAEDWNTTPVWEHGEGVAAAKQERMDDMTVKAIDHLIDILEEHSDVVSKDTGYVGSIVMDMGSLGYRDPAPTGGGVPESEEMEELADWEIEILEAEDDQLPPANPDREEI